MNTATVRHIATPAAPKGVSINRPTIPRAQLRALKAAAGNAGAAKPSRQAEPSSTNQVIGQANLSSECAAGDGCFFPPDTHGAPGLTEFVTVTNSHIDIYTKSPSAPALLFETTLNSFFGYAAEAIFDPQVQYDARWNRWVVVAEAFEEPDNDQFLFIAISDNATAVGSYIVYAINVNTISVFLDYPKVSLTQDAVVVSFNDFGPGGFLDGNIFAVAKAILYNGAGFSVPVFGGFTGTVTPPNVIDQNPRLHALEFTPGVGARNVEFRNPQAGLYGGINSVTPIAGEQITPPPDAPQPAVPACAPAPESNCNVDTLDGRFVDEGTQYGDHLWAAHSTNLAGFAAVRWYDFDTEGAGANTIKQDNWIFISPSSHDFNPAIAAQQDGRAYVSWSTTDPPEACATGCPGMAFSGRLSTDPVNTLNPPSEFFNSGVKLMGNLQSGRQRWGDYSSIRFDPAIFDRAYLYNERVLTTSLWGSRQAAVRVVAGPPPPGPLCDPFEGTDSSCDLTELESRISGGGSRTSTTTGSTGEPGEPDHAGVSVPLESNWYHFTPTLDGEVNFNTCTGTSYDTVLAAYTGASVGTLTEVTSNDDTPGCGRLQSSITFAVTAGTTYHIAIDGFLGADGPYRLSFDGEFGAPCDSFGSAHPSCDVSELESRPFGGGTRVDTTTGSTGEPGEPDHAGVSEPLESNWYHFTPTLSGEVNFNTCTGTSYDTVLAAYTGATVGTLTEVTSNDDTEGCGDGFQSSITFAVAAGITYHVAIDGFLEADGPYTLSFGPTRS